MQETTKTAGTFRIEGMLQGPMPMGGGDYQEKINAWMAAAKQKGLAFSLDGSGGQFSMLAENRTMRSSILAAGGGVSASLKEIFEKLLECFPVQDRMGLFSTLRSIEYRPGSEVQSIYAVVAPGAIDCQERVLDANTVVPAPELTTQGKIKVAMLGLGTLLVLGAIAAFFFKPQLEEAADNLSTLKAADIKLESTAYDDYLSIKKKKVDKGIGGLVVEVTKGAKWAESIADAEASAPADLKWDTLLAVGNLRRGYVRCELFDKDDKYIGSTEMRLGELLKAGSKEKVSAVIALPRTSRPAKIKLTL